MHAHPFNPCIIVILKVTPPPQWYFWQVNRKITLTNYGGRPWYVIIINQLLLTYYSEYTKVLGSIASQTLNLDLKLDVKHNLLNAKTGTVHDMIIASIVDQEAGFSNVLLSPSLTWLPPNTVSWGPRLLLPSTKFSFVGSLSHLPITLSRFKTLKPH